MAASRKLSSTHLLSLLGIGFISIAAMAMFWVLGEYADFTDEANTIRLTYVERQRADIKAEVDRAVEFIQYSISTAEDRLRNDIRSRTQEAVTIAESVVRQHAQHAGAEEMVGIVREVLRPIRYNAGRGYYFMTRMDGVELLFATSPELEGQNLLQMRDTAGKPVIEDMIRLVREAGQGFYEYTWTKPSAAGNAHRKIAYVQYFPPLDCLIGTGEYLDDVHQDIQKEVLGRLASVRFDPGGYLFGSTMVGDPLFTNGNVTKGGANILGLQDPHGVMIIQDQIAMASRPDGGFTEYSWRKLAGQEPSPKISFVRGVPEWGWLVGAGFYVDDVEQTIARMQQALWADMRAGFVQVGVLFFGVLAMATVMAAHMARGVRRHFEVFDNHFRQAALAHTPLQLEELDYEEFRALATAVNHMLAREAQAEEALRESEARFRNIVSNLPMGMHVYDLTPEGQLRFAGANPAADAIQGPHRTPAVGQDLVDAYPYITRTDLPERYRQAARDGTPWSTELVIREGGGETGRVRSAYWVHAFQVSLMRVGILFQDITDRKRNDEALQESEDAFRRLFEESSDAILLFKDGRILEYNQAALTMLGGVSKETFRNATAADISPRLQPDGRPSVEVSQEHIATAFSQGFHRFDWQCKRTDGSTFMVDVSLTPITLRGEALLYVTWRDVTARIMAHDELERAVADRTRELQEANARLLELDKLKSSFLSTASHELRTPLTSILGFAKLIRRDAARLGASLLASAQQEPACPPLAARMVDNAEIIIAESLRLTRLINDLLDLNRIESGRMEWQERLVDVGSLAAEVVEFMRGQLEGHTGVVLQATIASGLPSLWADPDRIRQVMLNLLTNALKFAPHGTVSLILGREDEHWVHLQVQDTGPGVPAEEQERIFEKYHQAAQGEHKPQGAGLGLAICRQIVEHYGGRIWVESTPGQGATFHVRLAGRRG